MTTSKEINIAMSWLQFVSLLHPRLKFASLCIQLSTFLITSDQVQLQLRARFLFFQPDFLVCIHFSDYIRGARLPIYKTKKPGQTDKCISSSGNTNSTGEGPWLLPGKFCGWVWGRGQWPAPSGWFRTQEACASMTDFVHSEDTSQLQDIFCKWVNQAPASRQGSLFGVLAIFLRQIWCDYFILDSNAGF